VLQLAWHALRAIENSIRATAHDLYCALLIMSRFDALNHLKPRPLLPAPAKSSVSDDS
jgi:hypothetical protein